MKGLRVKFLVLSIFVLILLSCEKNLTRNLQGDWRECINDSVIVDYIIKKDTIEIKYCDLNWWFKIPYYTNDSKYLCKDSGDCIYFEKVGNNYNKVPLIFNLIEWSDSSAVITHTQEEIKFVKLKRYQNRIPIKIKFDLYHQISKNAINEYGLGEGDYELNIDGSYRFYLMEKLHTGNLKDTLLNEFKIYYNFIDTTDKRITKHYFEIHQNKHDYRISLYFNDKTEYYEITDRQPYQFNRLSYTLEKIWYEILKQSGHRIL